MDIDEKSLTHSANSLTSRGKRGSKRWPRCNVMAATHRAGVAVAAAVAHTQTESSTRTLFSCPLDKSVSEQVNKHNHNHTHPL